MVRMFAAVFLALFAATGVAQAGGNAVKGTVSFKGKAPERKEVNMKSDPYCAKQPAAQDEEIVVGKGGSVVKQIGTRARPEIEHVLGHPVFLELNVKVRPRWRRDEAMLERLGL